MRNGDNDGLIGVSLLVCVLLVLLYLGAWAASAGWRAGATP
jgi:hypothetical protein